MVVGGVQSASRVLANSVFQGTVLGPPLWNIFYRDADGAVHRHGFTDVVFVHDFNSWKRFRAGTEAEEIIAACRACQASIHEWGRANSAKFDPSKESFHILHRARSHGGDFLLLGILFDCELRMGSAVNIIAREAGWRLKAILRPRRFFDRRELVNLYKSQILSYIEAGKSAIYHAAP